MNRTMCEQGILVGLLAAMLGTAHPVLAADQEKFPGKPITIVVPYEAGGGGDVYSRVIQPFLTKQLGGTPIVVQNTPGAGGIVGYAYVSQKKNPPRGTETPAAGEGQADP